MTSQRDQTRRGDAARARDDFMYAPDPAARDAAAARGGEAASREAEAPPTRRSRLAAAMERSSEAMAGFQDRYRFPGAGDLLRTKASRTARRAERAARPRQ